MQRKVYITISGERGSGKTTALMIIAKALRDAGCEVDFDIPWYSRKHAFNRNIETLDLSMVQPMDVTITEVLRGNSD